MLELHVWGPAFGLPSIAQVSAGEWVLDAGLPELEGADCIAYDHFLDLRG